MQGSDIITGSQQDRPAWQCVVFAAIQTFRHPGPVFFTQSGGAYAGDRDTGIFCTFPVRRLPSVLDFQYNYQ
ncbi:MAG: hypothetical protein H6696_17105 [Deferribacteres bacterium]|nr:hypothetical protein [Deferribacteres bacterium]